MSYDAFGKLRFLDFFPKTDAYDEDHEGGMETGIGIACTEGYLWSMFTSPADEPWHTVEICLELGNDCPEPEARRLLDSLGIPLRTGMSSSEVREILGTPQKDDPRWLVFEIGDEYRYYVGCLFTEDGLGRVWICRKDLADRNTEILGG